MKLPRSPFPSPGISNTGRKIPKRNTVYIALLYLMIDSIIQYGTCLWAEVLFSNIDNDLIMQTISLVNNIVLLILTPLSKF